MIGDNDGHIFFQGGHFSDEILLESEDGERTFATLGMYEEALPYGDDNTGRASHDEKEQQVTLSTVDAEGYDEGDFLTHDGERFCILDTASDSGQTTFKLSPDY